MSHHHPYDALVAVSEKLAEAPLRRHVEGPTLFEAVGDVAGRAVLELACGTGLYARQLARRGATRVVGVDQSEAQIACAQHLEAQDPLGIDYRAGDAAALDDLGTFDVVVASHLFHYAPSKAALNAMCRGARRSLVDGGRLVALVMNTPGDGSGIAIGVPGWYARYGFDVTGAEQDGVVVTLASTMPELPFAISAFYWSRATYDAALVDAGFRDITWSQPEPDRAGAAAFGEAFWAPYLRRPHVVVVSATAAAG